jgi:hypothetical protein
MDKSPTNVGRKSDRGLINVGQKLNDGNVTDNVMDATTLQSAREFHNDGGHNMTATTLWGMCELCGNGKRQRNECHATTCDTTNWVIYNDGMQKPKEDSFFFLLTYLLFPQYSFSLLKWQRHRHGRAYRRRMESDLFLHISPPSSSFNQ